MVGLFQLKHLHRIPLNLDSLPDRLCEQIISKQSAAAIFNLLHTNVKYCSMVELILSRNPNVELIRKVLQHGKEKLLRPEHITALFPPPSSSKDKLFWRNINLDGWLQAIRKDIDFFFCISGENNDSVKSLLKQMTPTTYHISELWEQQQHLGLKEIPLQSIPVHLWTDILKKATAVSATRLVKINSTVAAVFDVYVESAGLVRTVIQNEHLLPKDPRILPNENKPIGVAALEYQYQLLDFHLKTLLANALGYLWCPSSSPNLPFTVKDKAPVEKKHEQMKKDTQKVLKESCPKRMEAWEDINTLLGYAHLPRKRYTLDVQWHLSDLSTTEPSNQYAYAPHPVHLTLTPESQMIHESFVLMGYSFNQQDRLPLSLDRIPYHLRLQIIPKQSAGSIFQLPYTNSKYSALVETALSSNPYLDVIRQMLIKYNKKSIIAHEDRESLFPASEHLGSLNNWIASVYYTILCNLHKRNIDCFTWKSSQKEKIKNQMKPLNTYHINELLKKQQCIGPKIVPLQSITIELWKKILPKATAVSTTRLARTQSKVAAVLDEYIESNEPVKHMVVYSPLLPRRSVTPVRWQLANDMRNFYLLSLFRMARGILLWDFSFETPPEEVKMYYPGRMPHGEEERVFERPDEEGEWKARELGEIPLFDDTKWETPYTLDEGALRNPNSNNIPSGIPVLKYEEAVEEVDRDLAHEINRSRMLLLIFNEKQERERLRYERGDGEEMEGWKDAIQTCRRLRKRCY